MLLLPCCSNFYYWNTWKYTDRFSAYWSKLRTQSTYSRSILIWLIDLLNIHVAEGNAFLGHTLLTEFRKFYFIYWKKIDVFFLFLLVFCRLQPELRGSRSHCLETIHKSSWLFECAICDVTFRAKSPLHSLLRFRLSFGLVVARASAILRKTAFYQQKKKKKKKT